MIIRRILLLLSLSSSFVCASIPQSIIRRHIKEAALQFNLPPKFVEAVMRHESHGRTHAVSPKGAMGLMQVMPRTADKLGIANPFHALDNLMGACAYLRELLNRYRGNKELALAAYNAGPHNVDRYKGIPPFKETQTYVQRVMATYAALRSTR